MGHLYHRYVKWTDGTYLLNIWKATCFVIAMVNYVLFITYHMINNLYMYINCSFILNLHWFTYWKWWFSIALLNYPGVIKELSLGTSSKLGVIKASWFPNWDRLRTWSSLAVELRHFLALDSQLTEFHWHNWWNSIRSKIPIRTDPFSAG
jgi:hypothetical protein